MKLLLLISILLITNNYANQIIDHFYSKGLKYPVVSYNYYKEKKIQFSQYDKKSLREFRKELRAQKKAIYGNLSKVLKESLGKSDIAIPVLIKWRNFHQYYHLTLKPYYSKSQSESEFYYMLSFLESKLGREIKADLIKHNLLSTFLSSHEIETLKFEKKIAKILNFERIPDQFIAHGNRNLDDLFGAPLNMGSINMNSLCRPNCGQGIKIGIVELKPLSEDALLGSFNTDWFSNLDPSSILSSPHGRQVAGILRNTNGNSTSEWSYGGAFAAELLYQSFISSKTPYENLANRGAQIINHSYGPAKPWDNPELEISYDRDDLAANENYILNIVSTGNNNDSSITNQLSNCVNHGVWTENQCKRVYPAQSEFNSLIVGSLKDPFTISSFAAWRDFNNGNEVPHVVALGESIHSIWGGGESWSGSSFAVPVITSLAANLMSKFRLWDVPETIKNVIMASGHSRPLIPGSSRWPQSTGTDLKTGSGIPDAEICDSILSQSHNISGRSYIFSNQGPYGNAWFSFNNSMADPDESTREFEIPIESNAGYLSFYVTWISDYTNASRGIAYDADDLDLVGYQNNESKQSSSSAGNTTERITFWHPGGSKNYYIVISLYERASEPSSSIYCNLAWVKSDER